MKSLNARKGMKTEPARRSITQFAENNFKAQGRQHSILEDAEFVTEFNKKDEF